MVLAGGCVIAEYAPSSASAMLEMLLYDCFLHQTPLNSFFDPRRVTDSQSLGEVPSSLTPRSEEIDQKLWHRSAMAVDDQRY